MLIIYVPTVTNRISYIFSFFFRQHFGLEYKITSEKQEFILARCPKFSYSENNLFQDQSFFSSHHLLFETDIHPIEIQTFIADGQIAFFRCTEGSFFPFDIYAASFYLVSRYEEYLPYKKDKYGRFDATESLACQKGFLEIPIINVWAEMLKRKLSVLFPELPFKQREFEYISTIDIDNAWAHLHKGLLRTGLSAMKHVLTFNFSGFIHKIKVLMHAECDPYDNYLFIKEIHGQYDIKPLFFILFSRYGKHDKNISTSNRQFKRLIKNLSAKYQVGIHPSFQSNKSIKILSEEKTSLEKLIDKQVTTSRQHYLYLKIPETYENLIKIGIKQDFSMGYSSHIGYRASYCNPFIFYNLKTNEETALEIIPFALMDVCFRDYLKIQPENALKKIKKMITSIKNVNGLFVSLWHNETLGDNNKNAGWRFVFEQMLGEIKNENKAS